MPRLTGGHRAEATVVLLVALAANALALAGGPSPLSALAGMTLMCVLPGYLLATLVLPRAPAPAADARPSGPNTADPRTPGAGAGEVGPAEGGAHTNANGPTPAAAQTNADASTPAGDALDRLLVGFGLGVGAMIAGGLLVHYCPYVPSIAGFLPGSQPSPAAAGPMWAGLIEQLHRVTPVHVLAAFDGLILVLLWLAARQGAPLALPRVPRAMLVAVAAVVLVAAALRLPQLGYAEFQGDEATIMLKAAAAVQGREDVLFVHKKGPAEILVPTLFYGLWGRIDETTARLPFALCTIVGIVALYQLGRAMFGSRVGLVAALVLAANGFFVAFGRIVQYQSVVFLMSVLAVLAAWRYGQSGAGARRFLALAVLFTSVGLMAHYDTLVVAPVVVAVALVRWRRQPGETRADLVAAAGASVVGAALLAAFYVPMVRHPYFQETTWKYLFELRLGGADPGTLRNTLPNALALATYYNSSYYLAGLACLLLAAIALGVRRGASRRVAAVVAGALALGGATLLWRPGWWHMGADDWGVVFLVAAAALLLAWRGPSDAWKATVLWFACGFILYTAVIKSPRTHFHVIFPAWSLLAAVAIDRGWCRLATPLGRRVVGGVLVVAYGVCCWYVWLMFVQHGIEYRRVFPAAYPPGYWRPPIELPSNGWFGFPYRAGWQAIGQLYHDGVLQGTYWSNEEENVTDWYTRGAPRCDLDPRYYFVAENVQDARPIPDDLAVAGYGEIAQVTSEGRTRIRVYERGVAAAEGGTSAGGVVRVPEPIPTYAVEDVAARFARETSGPDFEPGLPYADQMGFAARPLGAAFRAQADRRPVAATPPGGAQATLRYFTLDTDRAAPGGELVVTLYWQAGAPSAKDYSVFVHLVDARDEARTVAQSDGAPGVCGEAMPMTAWRSGRIYLDRHVLHLPADAPPGDYALNVGLYDYETLVRLEAEPAPGAGGLAPGAGGRAGDRDEVRIQGVTVAERAQ